MINISDLSYVEVVSASSVVGGASQISGTSTSTTNTDKSFSTKQADFRIDLPNSQHTYVETGMILSDGLNMGKTLAL